MRYFIIMLVCLSVISCKTVQRRPTAWEANPPPTPEQIAVADCGAYPDNYKEIIVNYYNSVLKDPDSAKFDFTREPVKWYDHKHIAYDCKPGYCVGSGYYVTTFCYKIEFLINAKNSFGGYTGWQYNAVYIRDGIIIDTTP